MLCTKTLNWYVSVTRSFHQIVKFSSYFSSLLIEKYVNCNLRKRNRTQTNERYFTSIDDAHIPIHLFFAIFGLAEVIIFVFIVAYEKHINRYRIQTTAIIYDIVIPQTCDVRKYNMIMMYYIKTKTLQIRSMYKISRRIVFLWKLCLWVLNLYSVSTNI